MQAKILIMAGGTGGHVFPALAVALAFREKGATVTWLGTRDKIEARVVPASGIEIDFLDIQNLRGKGLLRWALLPFRLLRAIWQAKRVIKNRKPNIVMGFGGFAAGPGGIAAILQRVPLILHEQNALAGLTNRVLARFATQVYAAFEGAFANKKIQARVVGNPLRAEILKASQLHPIRPPSSVLRLLIVGGSLGASALNEVVPKALAQLPKGSFEIWHQSGEKTIESAKQQYQNAGVEGKIVPFIEDMAAAYQWADVVISRAGALTVSELAAMGKPSILVPLPIAADDHQRYNAEYLAKQGAAICIIQKEFTPSRLIALLNEWLKDRMPLIKMGQQARTLAKLTAVEEMVSGCLP